MLKNKMSPISMQRSVYRCRLVVRANARAPTPGIGLKSAAAASVAAFLLVRLFLPSVWLPESILVKSNFTDTVYVSCAAGCQPCRGIRQL